MKYYFLAWKNYIKFHGRASRSEYWYFTFINIAISIAIHQISVRAGMKELFVLDMGQYYWNLGPIYKGDVHLALDQNAADVTYLAAVLLPLICVGVRRMQDVNKTGWHLLIPLYGQYLSILDGHEEDNKYGPKATA